jgi:lysozyme family protein
MTPEFIAAFTRLHGTEGGYQSPEEAIARGDPGGETKFGICKRSYPHLDIKNLTLEGAQQIAWIDFWLKAGCGVVPPPMRYDLFEMSFQSGVHGAARMLQEAAEMPEEDQDGVIGEQTMQRLASVGLDRVVARWQGLRLRQMTTWQSWDQEHRGLARRVADALLAL